MGRVKPGYAVYGKAPHNVLAYRFGDDLPDSPALILLFIGKYCVHSIKADQKQRGNIEILLHVQQT
jgi:hypothetical protein